MCFKNTFIIIIIIIWHVRVLKHIIIMCFNTRTCQMTSYSTKAKSTIARMDGCLIFIFCTCMSVKNLSINSKLCYFHKRICIVISNRMPMKATPHLKLNGQPPFLENYTSGTAVVVQVLFPSNHEMTYRNSVCATVSH